MVLNMSGVDVRELLCEMYCGVMAWLTRVGGVGDITFKAQSIRSYDHHQ